MEHWEDLTSRIYQVHGMHSLRLPGHGGFVCVISRKNVKKVSIITVLARLTPSSVGERALDIGLERKDLHV
jgi:hypothetical protein